ncbi:MAG TPA: hypothetical protein EYH34_04620 [Planctomycetes bacterium]|nr:hypothetical protein [Planctomycetota bacterium]
MQIVIAQDGSLRAVYAELIDLAALGQMEVRRASWVDPDGTGRWWADLSPAGGPVLGPFHRRSDALAAEQAWLESHWLATTCLSENNGS